MEMTSVMRINNSETELEIMMAIVTK